MSAFAPVCPVHIAHELQTAPQGDLFGSYHLPLAHDVLANPAQYKIVFEQVRRAHESSIVILDNSVIELGDSLNLELLVEASKIVKPDYLVIPDEVGDANGSRRKAEVFCRDFVKYCAATDWTNAPGLMAVIHGKSLREYLRSAIHMYAMPMVTAIGVPRAAVDLIGSRAPIVQGLMGVHKFELVHLLGFSDDLLDDVSCARMPIVSGIDSAVPIRCGIKEEPLVLDGTFEAGKREGYWETPVETVRTRMSEIEGNLRTIRDWIFFNGDTED